MQAAGLGKANRAELVLANGVAGGSIGVIGGASLRKEWLFTGAHTLDDVTPKGEVGVGAGAPAGAAVAVCA
jgi:hypothetical protein